MPEEVTRMIASVGCSMVGSGTSSTRTSCVPCQVTAFIVLLASVTRPRSGGLAARRGRGLLGGLLDLREGVPLLLEILLEELDDVALAHGVGVGDETLIDRDLMVLGLGRTGEQHVVDHGVVR